MRDAVTSLMRDHLVLGLILLLGTLHILRFYDFTAYPMEDAAMLLRYSEHLAQGEGIVWNPGEAPVDGATDFLYMVMVAGLHKLGVGLLASGRILGLAAHYLAVILLFRIIRREYEAPRFAAALSAAYLMVGPAPAYVEAGFGAPVFALFILLAWNAALHLRREANWPWAVAFAGFSLLAGLTRPEGVFFCAAMLAWLLIEGGIRKHGRTLAAYTLLFVLPGALYFIWRWSHFGHPLPNPFYVKGGIRGLFPLIESVKNSLVLCAPFLLAMSLSLRNRSLFLDLLKRLSPVLLFVLIWGMVKEEMNYNMRFQYAILPLVLCTWPLAFEGIWEDIRTFGKRIGQAGSRAMLIALSLGALVFMHQQFAGRWRMMADSRYDLGLALRPLAQEGYTMAVSEAGYLPFASGWRAIDSYGLNDAHIAQHGLSAEYLDRYKPELIMFHAYDSPLLERNDEGDGWSRMCAVMRDYAQSHGYTLAAAYGINPYDTHYYYVAPDFSHSAEIVRLIRERDYLLGWYPRPAVDFSRFAPTRSATGR